MCAPNWKGSLPASLLLLFALAYQAPGAPGLEAPENLALGRPYQLDPAPNYAHCTDPGDRTQLTDGDYVSGYFWTQPGTVGWSGRAAVFITLDLGKSEPISGLSISTAAGTAGVHWPTAIFILVSEDNRVWHLAGDIAALSMGTLPPADAGYATHRFITRDLTTRGRFIKLLVVPDGSFAFVDEMEVYRATHELPASTNLGPAILDVREFFEQTCIEAGLRRRLAHDVEAVTAAFHAADVSEQFSREAQTELSAIREAIPLVIIDSSVDFTTVFPINDLHRRIFAIQSGLWRALGLADLVVWQNNRWDMLSPTAPPMPGQAIVEVAMMSHEYRSAAFNLSNAGEADTTVSLSLEGLPGGTNPDYITVHEVPFTDTQSGVPVAAALPMAREQAGHFVFQIPAGLTRQVWLTIHPTTVTAGTHRGRIMIESGESKSQVVPMELKIYPLRFPDTTTLHLAGWDYTDRDSCYQVTPENRDAFIRHLREHFVDSPWAQSAVLARGRHDAQGRMVESPDPSEFRTWLNRWPQARNYYVFANVGERFAGFAPGTPAFERAVADWITWWVDQLKEWQVQPGQLGLLLVDEPHSTDEDRRIIEYAKVIRAAQPGVILWEDPTWRDPTQATPELFELSHVLCPNLPMWLSGGQPFAEFYLNQRAAGRRLWFYSCSAPGRLLDPYAYHRMQPWFCWKYGAEGAAYWAFGDSNGASSWNDISTQRGAYTPLFLDRSSVTAGKHMEAIREGVEDFEYLRMLRDRVEALEHTGTANGRLQSARELLTTGPDRVTGVMTSASLIHWKEPKDRSVADQVRVEILEALMQLQD